MFLFTFLSCTLWKHSTKNQPIPPGRWKKCRFGACQERIARILPKVPELGLVLAGFIVTLGKVYLATRVYQNLALTKIGLKKSNVVRFCWRPYEGKLFLLKVMLVGLVRLAKMTGFRENVKLVEEAIMIGPGFMIMSLVMDWSPQFCYFEKGNSPKYSNDAGWWNVVTWTESMYFWSVFPFKATRFILQWCTCLMSLLQ